MLAWLNFLQGELTSSTHIRDEDMPFGSSALKLNLPPCNANKWFAAGIVFGLHPQFTPANDGLATMHIANQAYSGLIEGEPAAAKLEKFESFYHRREHFGLIPYRCMVNGKAEKLVALAFSKTDEGNALAAELLDAGWDQEEDAPKEVILGGGNNTTYYPFPPEKKRPWRISIQVPQGYQRAEEVYLHPQISVYQPQHHQRPHFRHQSSRHSRAPPVDLPSAETWL